MSLLTRLDRSKDLAPTPGYQDGMPNTPYNPATPSGYATNPFTPAAIPSTPGAMPSHAGPDAGAWATTDIQVKLVVSRAGTRYRDGAFDGQEGQVKAVDRYRGCTVKISGGDQVIPTEFLAPVPPEKKQNFKVLSGEHQGKTGMLLSIDNQEGVVRFTNQSEILMMQYSLLARHVG